MGYASPTKMLREMGSGEWLDWKSFMELEPAGEELANLRAAQIVAAIWNGHIAEWQGNWDAATTKTTARPEKLDMRNLVLRFGDTPPYVETRKMTDQEQFEAVAESFRSWSMTPVGEESK